MTKLQRRRVPHRPRGSDPIIRFTEARCPCPDLEGPCHVFDGAKIGSGYGNTIHKGKSVLVHRYVWVPVEGKTDFVDCLDAVVVIEVKHEPDQKDPNKVWPRIAFNGIHDPNSSKIKDIMAKGGKPIGKKDADAGKGAKTSGAPAPVADAGAATSPPPPPPSDRRRRL